MGRTSGQLVHAVRAQRPRGRPQRLPVDPYPVSDRRLDVASRTAWLLAVNRLLSPATRGVSRTEFIERMRERGVVLDASRVSRWETGALPVDARLVADYEAVVGVGDSVLVAAHSLLRRAGRADDVRPEPPTVETTGRLDALFERAERHEATGGDWLLLASDLARHEHVYLHPATWTDLCDRLVAEVSRTSGVSYLTRYEAATTLMSTPAGSRHMSLSIGRFVMHPDAQNVTSALGLLREVPDDNAHDVLLRLISSDNRILSQGAAIIAGSLAAKDEAPHDAQTTLERHTIRELRHDADDIRRYDALDLVSHLSDLRYDRVLGSVQDPVLRRQLAQVRATSELVASDLARIYADGVAAYAEAALERAAHDPDVMLRRLVREALFHAQRERRHLAAIMLAASPYAAAVTHAVLGLVRDEPVVSATAWTLLRRMGQVLTREQAMGAALAEHRPGLRVTALVTAGLCHGPFPDDAADALVAELDGATDELRQAALFALGLSGHPRLHELLSHPDEQISRAARWWTTLGPALHDLPEPATASALG